MPNLKATTIILLIMISFIGCNENGITIEEPIELITTLKLTLTQQGGGDPVIFSFQDLDGEGGSEPIIMEGKLQVSSVYSGMLELLNEAESPPINVSDEINAEKEEHQFFYAVSGVDLTIEYDDADSNQYPVGMATVVTSGNAGTGTLTITLRHEPDKSAMGVSDGDITNAGGETDIEVTFNVVIQ